MGGKRKSNSGGEEIVTGCGCLIFFIGAAIIIWIIEIIEAIFANPITLFILFLLIISIVIVIIKNKQDAKVYKERLKEGYENKGRLHRIKLEEKIFELQEGTLKPIDCTDIVTSLNEHMYISDVIKPDFKSKDLMDKNHDMFKQHLYVTTDRIIIFVLVDNDSPLKTIGKHLKEIDRPLENIKSITVNEGKLRINIEGVIYIIDVYNADIIKKIIDILIKRKQIEKNKLSKDEIVIKCGYCERENTVKNIGELCYNCGAQLKL